MDGEIGLVGREAGCDATEGGVRRPSTEVAKPNPYLPAINELDSMTS